MSSPPETDRQYAYFRAIGEDNPAEVTSLLGVEPNECWRTGDVFERRGHTFRRKSSSWRLDSGLEDTEALDRHVEALLTKLTPRKDELLRVRVKFKTQIVCVSYSYQSFSWELDFDVQRSATALGIGFWIDAYSFGDHHEEMVALREQLKARAKGPAR
ncbi:DUF4279 domain-containing protein [Mesorhizobium sp. IMUNJ 23033]|uniref:DUF4279 domain-containing protein n=1 Tax=Mesorhizobium sp. IMUNJ 23033 TaxID=3378039 RepID=UPI00384F5451